MIGLFNLARMYEIKMPDNCQRFEPVHLAQVREVNSNVSNSRWIMKSLAPVDSQLLVFLSRLLSELRSKVKASILHHFSRPKSLYPSPVAIVSRKKIEVGAIDTAHMRRVSLHLRGVMGLSR